MRPTMSHLTISSIRNYWLNSPTGRSRRTYLYEVNMTMIMTIHLLLADPCYQLETVNASNNKLFLFIDKSSNSWIRLRFFTISFLVYSCTGCRTMHKTWTNDGSEIKKLKNAWPNEQKMKKNGSTSHKKLEKKEQFPLMLIR